MRPVQYGEILDLKSYESVRDATRAKVIALKEPRRVHVGAHMTLLFENRDTVRYQVQEMLRVERLTSDRELRHEVDTYNELVPGAHELSATLLIEYETPEERDRKLRELVGLEKGGLSLVVGSRPPVPARFDLRQVSDRRLSSVHYVRFVLGPELAQAFETEGLQGNVRAVVNHPAYEAETVLMPKTVLSLAQDLREP